MYGSRSEDRPELGEGRHPEVADIRRAVRLARAVNGAAAGVAAVLALAGTRFRPAVAGAPRGPLHSAPKGIADPASRGPFRFLARLRRGRAS